MSQTGYRIIKEAPAIKKRAAVEAECRCPVCNMTEGIKVTEYSTDQNTMQNMYECPQCGTQWAGNYYDAGWNHKKGLNLHLSPRVKQILWFVFYALACSAVSSNHVFNKLGVVLFNIIMVVAFLLAGAMEFEKGRKRFHLTNALGFFATNIAVIFFNIFA